MRIVVAMLILLAGQVHAMDEEPFSVIGDSWAGGLAWTMPEGDAHYEGGSTTRDWPKRRVRELDLHRVVYIQLGANDMMRWIIGGRDWKSKHHPRRAAKRIRRIARWLEDRGHEVWVLDYYPIPDFSVPALLLKRLCRLPVGEIGWDPIHLSRESYAQRVLWLRWDGCHLTGR